MSRVHDLFKIYEVVVVVKVSNTLIRNTLGKVEKNHKNSNLIFTICDLTVEKLKTIPNRRWKNFLYFLRFSGHTLGSHIFDDSLTGGTFPYSSSVNLSQEEGEKRVEVLTYHHQSKTVEHWKYIHKSKHLQSRRLHKYFSFVSLRCPLLFSQAIIVWWKCLFYPCFYCPRPYFETKLWDFQTEIILSENVIAIKYIEIS